MCIRSHKHFGQIVEGSTVLDSARDLRPLSRTHESVQLHVGSMLKYVSTAFRASGSWPCIGHQIKCKTTHCQSSGSRPYHHRPMLHQAANSRELAGILLSDPQILSLRSSTKIMPPEESYRPYVHVTGSEAVPYQGCRARLMQHGSPEQLHEPTIRNSTSFSICVISCVGIPHHLWLNILTGGILMLLRAASGETGLQDHSG